MSEFDQLGEVLKIYKNEELFELKLKLKDTTTKDDIDAVINEVVLPVYPHLITYDLRGGLFKCSYSAVVV